MICALCLRDLADGQPLRLAALIAVIRLARCTAPISSAAAMCSSASPARQTRRCSPYQPATARAKFAAAYHLIDGDNARQQTGEPIMRAADEPAMAMRATRTTVHRAHISGQWVRMTIQSLGRFQTVPDSYQGLTSGSTATACRATLLKPLWGRYEAAT